MPINDALKKACFINPYNFIPLRNTPQRADQLNRMRGELTGSIKCTIKLKTPLAMPDHECESIETLHDTRGNEFKHSNYPFYTIKGVPIIPGSEIRGMIRSVFEAETNSCMSVLDNAQLYGRSPIPKNNGGLVFFEDGQWKLQKADILLVYTFSGLNDQDGPLPDRYTIQGGNLYTQTGVPVKDTKEEDAHSGSEVRFTKSGYTYKTSRGFNTGLAFATRIGSRTGEMTGYLLLGEKGLNPKHRHNSHILVPNGAVTVIERECVENLKDDLLLFRSKEINKVLAKNDGSHRGYEGYTIKEDGSKTPVFFSKVGNRYYLSPAMIGREIYYRHLHDIAGAFAPCSGERESLCPACALFGTVGADGSGLATGSSVRFSDAAPDENEVPLTWMGSDRPDKITLPELSGPKITSSEFYFRLNPHNADDRVWNVDYRTTDGAGRADRGGRASSYGEPKTISENELSMNGRKFFWHHSQFSTKSLIPKKDPVTGMQKTNRNLSTPILEKGMFRFTIYFDKISEEALNKLLWAVSPKSGDMDLCHKIGFGKPLGLGSIKIDIQSVTCRTYAEGQYKVEPHSVDVSEANPPAELIRMLDFNSTGEYKVQYPYGTRTTGGNNDEGGHVWFTANRNSVEGATGTNPKYNYTLAAVSRMERNGAYALTLPFFEYDPRSRRYSPISDWVIPDRSDLGNQRGTGSAGIATPNDNPVGQNSLTATLSRGSMKGNKTDGKLSRVRGSEVTVEVGQESLKFTADGNQNMMPFMWKQNHACTVTLINGKKYKIEVKD